MRTSTETLYRQWALLKRIPRYPRKLSTGELHAAVRDEFPVDKRTIERDLKSLLEMGAFPLDYEEDGRARKWFWIKDSQSTEIPGMSLDTAFAFRLAQTYLTDLMPRSVLAHLEDYFQKAYNVLADTHLAAWLSKVQVLTRGPVLLSPPIDPAVRDIVYDALLKNRRFTVDYTPREGQGGHYEINPLGLVVREGVFYLVATLWDYEDIRQLALHRMANPTAQDDPARHPPEFDLGRYVAEQYAFAYPHQQIPIQLRALFDDAAAFHLGERKLSEDQRLEPQDDGRILLEATVPDTEELRWWLMGFGDQVEVLMPEGLREELTAVARGMARTYGLLREKL